MAELYGKITGCSKGKGGSMHMFSKEKKFFGGHGIVGAQIPLGAGIAFAEQYLGTKNVNVCYMGDGAVRQGALNETFNMAMLWKLPVVFICENNGYAMGTSVARTTNMTDIYKIGLGFDMPCAPVDGMDPVAVHNAMDEAVNRARNGEGPTFLEMRTYRYKGHSMSDPAKYRTKEELEGYKAKDPILTVKKAIVDNSWADEAWFEGIDNKIKAIVEESVKFAEDSPYPEPNELYKDVYVQEDYPYITS
jgi:pyruvate dehydrogenase E1 component alpha subunit